MDEHWPADHWECGDCGWPWPMASDPDSGHSCDNCGGELLPVDEDGNEIWK
jgi:hypothetical protein